MSARFVNVDRDTPLLLPVDMRLWVPEDDLVHFVLAAVEGVCLSAFRVNDRGTGSEQYPPRMMLALLIYCHANGLFGSRRIERATYRDVGVRYLTGDRHPDHDTVCKFRRENSEAFGEAFLEVLKLAREAGLLRVGTVSVDGSKIRANASKQEERLPAGLQRETPPQHDPGMIWMDRQAYNAEKQRGGTQEVPLRPGSRPGY